MCGLCLLDALAVASCAAFQISCVSLTAAAAVRRAELLYKELNWMALNRDAAHDAVGSKVDYWSL